MRDLTRLLNGKQQIAKRPASRHDACIERAAGRGCLSCIHAYPSRQTPRPTSRSNCYAQAGVAAGSRATPHDKWARYWCTSVTAIAPSPTAEATRLIEP